MKNQILLYFIMNTRNRGMFAVCVVVCIVLLVCICIKNKHEEKNLYRKIALLLSYATYSADMLKDMSIEGLGLDVFPESNTLIYCFSENMCDECIYQDLSELYEIQKDIGKNNVLLLPAYGTDRTNQIILRNKFSNFRYINIPVDSITFPFHRGNGMEQRFFVFTDESGRIRSLFFPKKNRQGLTHIYLNSVKSQMR